MSSTSKSEGKKPVSQKQIVFPPLPNRFSPLTPEKFFSEIIQNSSSKLIVQNPSPIRSVSPFIKTPTPVSITKPTSTPTSKAFYISNPNLQRIQILEDSQIAKIGSGFHILTDHIFGQGKTFYTNRYKTRDYYQTILEESGSVQITHKCSRDGTIEYSKALIVKIITPENWGPLWAEKPLPGYIAYPSYSYHDYQEAWTKAFLIRNYSHSWFIFFDLNFDCEYPKWFVNWYKFMGLIPNCLPEPILKGFQTFKELFVQPIPEFEYMLQFTMLFKIPWITVWTYHYQEAKDTSPPWLNRQYRLKWWDKFKIEQANKTAVIKHHQKLLSVQQPQPVIEDVNTTTPLSDKEIVARLMGAAGSSAEDFQRMIQEIKRNSSSESSSPSTEFKQELFQDAQDPYEDPYDD